MKTIKFILLVLLLIVACEPVYKIDYQKIKISKGSHSSHLRVELLQNDIMKYWVKFDSSAIYTSQTKENQWDTNKLFGFSDCNEHHHQNSARFGWRWLENKIDIMIYCYIDGERIIEKIGEVNPMEEHLYNIQMTEDAYHFTLDNVSQSISRRSSCQKGLYYTLWPYFGGDEKAPHDITLYFKDPSF